MRTRISGVIGAVLLATAAWAQASPPPPAAMGDRAGMMADMAQRRAAMAARRAAHEAEREADLALILDLRPPQRALLHAYLTAMRPPMDGPGDRAHRPHDGGNDRARPDFGANLAEMQAHFDQDTREEQARLGAARAFYAGLDAGQRAKFEAVRRLDHPHHGPMMMAHAGPPPFDGHGPGEGRPPGDMPPPNGD